MKPIKVLHLVPAPFGTDGIFGGAERYALELAKAMAAKVPTRLVTFGKGYRETIHPCGLTEIVLGNSYWLRGQRTNPYHSGMFRHFYWADVIHCHQNHVLSAEMAGVFGLLTGKKVFASDLGGGGWGLHGYMKTGSLFRRHLHISEYSRKLSGHDQNPRSKVIYGGVDTDRFKPDREITKEPLVVFVGRVMPHKGVNDLIEGLPEGLDLEIIGRPYNTEFQNHLDSLALGKRVVFRTDCSDQEIVRAYQRARCVALPSVYRDCYGNETKVPELLGQTLLEGMACGTPGLATNVASLAEIVENEVSGWIVEPNDPKGIRRILEKVRDQPGLLKELGNGAREKILIGFTWNKTVESCLEAYGN